ncbi:Uncharacterised protein [Legionella lansingensis]|uniref:Capsule polysaccharide biosynthesis protein n=1 Tax=Legionella lansingensis TaxID=45067 RepID=A0A0W0VWK1_9GAMM|nr:hypothetical protein [Legionella lansingensis]KTD24317.1 hypothetical protein Llan_0456 [Legionella lansingensis]SNV51813.1 Uncharacterised protein [Legionella lansingensis]
MNLLLFAEDPGAVNYIAPLALELQTQGSSITLLSAGAATQLFQEKGLSSHVVCNSAEAIEILYRELPELLITGTSENLDSPGLAFLSAAQDMQITSIGVVDFYANAAFRFRGQTHDPLAHAPDWLIVPDDWTAEEYQSLGFPKQKILVAGHPHYDHLMQMKERFDKEDRDILRTKLFPQVSENQLVLVFASELSTGLNPAQYQYSEEYTLTGRGHSVGRTEIVIEELLDAIAVLSAEGVPRPYLVLRRHPKEATTSLSDYLNAFDCISEGGDPHRLIYTADAVVGMSSMLLLEAYILGARVLSILPREIERSWLPLTRMQTIKCATQRDIVRAYLRELLCSSFYRASTDLGGTPLDSTKRIMAFLKTRCEAMRKEYYV